MNAIQSIKSIESIIEFMEVKSEELASASLLHIKFIANKSMKKKMNSAAIHSAISARNITCKLAMMNMNDQKTIGFLILKEIGIASARLELADALKSVLDSFEFMIKNHNKFSYNDFDLIKCLGEILEESRFHNNLLLYSNKIECLIIILHGKIVSKYDYTYI